MDENEADLLEERLLFGSTGSLTSVSGVVNAARNSPDGGYSTNEKSPRCS